MPVGPRPSASLFRLGPAVASAEQSLHRRVTGLGRFGVRASPPTDATPNLPRAAISVTIQPAPSVPQNPRPALFRGKHPLLFQFQALSRATTPGAKSWGAGREEAWGLSRGLQPLLMAAPAGAPPLPCAAFVRPDGAQEQACADRQSCGEVVEGSASSASAAEEQEEVARGQPSSARDIPDAASAARQGDVNDSDDIWMRQELDPARIKVDAAVEVFSQGEWWDCLIRDVNAEKNEIRVHYVGGVEDEDEWVPVDQNRVQLPPLVEIIWAKGGSGVQWPSIVMEGSLRNSDCKRLRVFHLQEMAALNVSRKFTSPFTPASIPRRCDEKLLHAVNIGKRAMQDGTLPEAVTSALAACTQSAGTARPSPSKARAAARGPAPRPYVHTGSSPAGRGKGERAGAANRVGESLTPRQVRRKTALRKLALIPPLDAGA